MRLGNISAMLALSGKSSASKTFANPDVTFIAIAFVNMLRNKLVDAELCLSGFLSVTSSDATDASDASPWMALPTIPVSTSSRGYSLISTKSFASLPSNASALI